MAREWPVLSIMECISTDKYATQIGPFGSALKVEDYRPTGVPLLRGVNVNRGRFHDDDFVFIDPDVATALYKYKAVPGDVILVHRGTLGKIGLIPRKPRFPSYIMGNSMLRIRCNADKLLPEFLYYWLTSTEGQHFISSRAVQVGVPALPTPLRTLRDLTLPIPPLGEQTQIVEMLAALDDKIELNRRMNATLEAMAQAVFKEWFVARNAPGGAKEEWKENSLSSLFTISKASVNPGASPETVFDHYSIPAFDEGRLPKEELGDTIKSNKFTVSDGCILISKLNPRFPRVWLPVLDGDRQAITSTEFIVCVPKSDELLEFIYGLFTSQRFASEFNNMATGSTGSHQRVRPESMLKMEMMMPDRSAIKAYSVLVRPMLERINADTKESRTLAALRDTLLPKLMRGEVRVKSNGSILHKA